MSTHVVYDEHAHITHIEFSDDVTAIPLVDWEDVMASLEAPEPIHVQIKKYLYILIFEDLAIVLALTMVMMLLLVIVHLFL